MSNKVIIDGVDVSKCERYCKFDNRNEKNKCWSYLSEGYSDCKPKENQCFFYVKEIEKQIKDLQIRKDKYYLNNLYYERKLSELTQALEEIRDIVKLVCKDLCNYCDWRNTDSCEPNEYTCGVFSKIQNKINEVLEDA